MGHYLLIGHTIEALKAIKINQNDGRAVHVFMSSKYRVTKGFKFHARPQTGAYSCLLLFYPYPNLNYILGPSFKVIFFSDYFDLICI